MEEFGAVGGRASEGFVLGLDVEGGKGCEKGDEGGPGDVVGDLGGVERWGEIKRALVGNGLVYSRGEVLVFENGRDGGRRIGSGLVLDSGCGIAIAEVDVTRLAILDVVDGNGQRGHGLRDVAFQRNRLLPADCFPCRLLEFEIARIGQAQLGFVGKCRLEMSNSMDKDSTLSWLVFMKVNWK